MVYSVTKYGAVGDGATNDAAAIQSAIDACNAAGGGRVVLEGGHTYYSSSIELKSNVDLHLEQGALLKAHSDISTYFNPNGDDASVAAVSGAKAVDRPVAKPAYTFIHAKDADNFSITGQGAVDGNVYAFMKRASRYYFNGDFYPRPTMVYVEHCNHISFHDVTLQNSPFWTLHPAGCNDVLISNIRVLNPLDCTNSDGIDPDHSTNVRIIGCHVQCADDCICLKTTAGNNEYGPTKNVIISNCTLTSTSAAIKIGTEGVADFENILVDNCIITGSNRGLSIQIRDGGCVRNVSFSNIMIETRRFAECWWGCAEPIVMTTHDRNANTHSGSIENVRFFNVTCKGENGVFLSGNEENHIKNVLFENVNVCLEATSKWERGMYDLRPIPPEKEGMLHQKSAAMFLRWVDGVTVRNSTLGFAGEDRSDFAQALLTQNCTNVQTMGLTAEAAPRSTKASNWAEPPINNEQAAASALAPFAGSGRAAAFFEGQTNEQEKEHHHVCRVPDPDGGSGRERCHAGHFSTIFSSHFQLSTAQLSQIVTVSYIGNLVFLAVGGFGVDILGRRKAMLLYTFCGAQPCCCLPLRTPICCCLWECFCHGHIHTAEHQHEPDHDRYVCRCARLFCELPVLHSGHWHQRQPEHHWQLGYGYFQLAHRGMGTAGHWRSGHGAVRAVPHAGSAGAQNGGEGIAQGDHELSGISVVGADHRPVFHCRTWHYELAGELCYQCTGSAHGTGGKLYRCFLRLCDGGASGAEQSGG